MAESPAGIRSALCEGQHPCIVIRENQEFLSVPGYDRIDMKIFLQKIIKEWRDAMKSLLVYLKNYKKESVLAPLFKMLEASFELPKRNCKKIASWFRKTNSKFTRKNKSHFYKTTLWDCNNSTYKFAFSP